MKDPAVLFYISDWLTSTSEMDADCRGWYLNLLLHNYDKKDLPSDIEKLAVLANVKFSEFERFKHVFKQIIEQKFEHVENDRITNARMQTVIRARETFTNKRSDAGKTSYIMRYFAKNYEDNFNNESIREYVKRNIDITIDIKNEHLIKHMFEHMFELYRNENENENEIEIEKEKRGVGKKTDIGFLDSEIFKKIADYFGLTEIRTPIELFNLNSFLNIRKNKGDLQLFIAQFDAYVLYKEKTKQTKHSFRSFIGDLEQDNGNWRVRDWVKELGTNCETSDNQDFFTNNPFAK